MNPDPKTVMTASKPIGVSIPNDTTLLAEYDSPTTATSASPATPGTSVEKVNEVVDDMDLENAESTYYDKVRLLGFMEGFMEGLKEERVRGERAKKEENEARERDEEARNKLVEEARRKGEEARRGRVKEFKRKTMDLQLTIDSLKSLNRDGVTEEDEPVTKRARTARDSSLA